MQNITEGLSILHKVAVWREVGTTEKKKCWGIDQNTNSKNCSANPIKQFAKYL